MKTIVQILILIFVVGICSCSRNNNEPRKNELNSEEHSIVHQSLIQVTETNPDSTAAKAIEQDRIFFLGIMGYALIVPGVDNYYERFQNQIPVKVIEGTSDFITSEEVRTLNAKARQYALRYNAVVLQWVQNHK